MVKFKVETKFKETEIGKIPKDWEVKKIKDIGEVAGGSTPSTKIKEYWEGNVPWITPKDLANYEYIYISRGERNITEKAVKDCSLRMFPKGTILLTSRAPIGYVAIAKNPLTTNQGFRNIIPNDKVVSEYIYYLFKTKIMNEYLKDISGGSTFPELKGSTLKEVKIPYPSPEEQQKIATILSYFDDLTENKKKQNEILEKIALGLFKNWFIDFEPFKDEEFVYNEELDKEIPEGWEVKPIGDIADFTSGLSYKGSEKLDKYEDEAYVFITLNNTIEGGGFKLVYSWIKSQRIKERHLISEGDIILPNTEQTKDARLLGSPGIVIFPPDYNKNCGVYSMDIVKVILTKDYYKYYLYFNFKINRAKIATFHSGTSIIHFKIKNFKENYYILQPPEQILQKFNSLVEPLFEKIINNQKQVMELKKIRDLLLPKLVFGKIRVEEI